MCQGVRVQCVGMSASALCLGNIVVLAHGAREQQRQASGPPTARLESLQRNSCLRIGDLAIHAPC
eukprot:COSAG03_NODE_42_length_17101_cov_8.739031_12_plen_65_part_00